MTQPALFDPIRKYFPSETAELLSPVVTIVSALLPILQKSFPMQRSTATELHSYA